MSKVVTLILIISSLFVVSLSIVALLLHKNNKTTVVSEQQHPAPTITAINTLTLVPQNSSVIKGQSNTIAIVLETQQSNFNTPRLVQMEIAYDPTALLDVDITPGDFFDNPTELVKIINPNTGRISYALSSDTTTTNPIVARLSFVPNPVFSKSETTVSFLGKTVIKGTETENLITATYGTKLYFATSSAEPQITQ